MSFEEMERIRADVRSEMDHTSMAQSLVDVAFRAGYDLPWTEAMLIARRILECERRKLPVISTFKIERKWEGGPWYAQIFVSGAKGARIYLEGPGQNGKEGVNRIRDFMEKVMPEAEEIDRLVGVF